ncbi:MAG TPA: Spy/CpxP family protein refolding chaperone [Pyrinomonadaceae bacterium]|nr:Spy/CpxP family protein refolding chaperone [Pyrinomonadaceae bacterium]
MKRQTNKRRSLMAAAAFLLLAAISTQTRAQAQTQQNPVEPSQAPANQPNQVPDLIGSLNLTPEQIQKWRAINADLRAEQQAANQHLRQARRALADAIESPTSNEDLIKQRAREVSEAQAATTQLQALKEARILQVLTPEQRVKLREIRERVRVANQQQRNGLGRRQNGRNNNANAPLRPNQRKLMRQQPKR